MVKKIVYILGRRRSAIYFLLASLAVLGAIIDTALTYVVLPFVSLIVTPDRLEDSSIVGMMRNWGIETETEQVCLMAVGIAVAYILRNVYMAGLNFFRCRFIADSKAVVSTKLFGAISNREYSFFTDTNTASIQRICINDITRLFGVIDSLYRIFGVLVTSLMIAGVLLFTDPVLTVVAVIIVAILTFAVNKPISRKASHLSKDYSFHYTKMLQWTQQFMGSTKAIITNNKQGFFRNKFSYHNKCFTRNEGNYSSIAELTGYVMNAVIMGMVFFYIAILSRTGVQIDDRIPVLALFAMAALKLMPSIANITSLINNMKYNEPGVGIIYDQISLNDGITESDVLADKREEDVLPALKEGILLENITFGYNDSDSPVIQNLDLTIPANASVAFVGTTGAGKTTLADIILGLLRPSEGSVSVDGVDISKHREWWANQIGYIPQTIYLCEDTIKSNIAFGIPEEQVDDEKVIECMKKAQIYDFVMSLPEKENTITGENGVKLSGGQRQRIGIARALYSNPPFLVMDEATSALDGETEKAIIETINSFSGEKTMLIIAHRLSTIEKCDIVYRIEGGKAIKQRG